MLKAFKKLLVEMSNESENNLLSEDQVRLACAALMIEIARIDEDFSAPELETLKSELVTVYQLSDQERDELIASADSSQEQAVSIFEFTSILNKSLSHAQKERLLTSLWKIAFADNYLDKYEEHLIRKIADLLYLSHSEFIRAKQAAKMNL